MLKRLTLVTLALLVAATAPAAAAAPTPTGEVVYTTRSAGKVLALTFDDGPAPEITPALLDLLREHRIRAVFCLMGSTAAQAPDLVKRIVADGHPLCNHSYAHEDLSALTPAEVRANLTATDAAIRQAAGNPGLPIPYFRAPFGSWGNGVTDIAASLGHSSVAWTVDPRDWDGSAAPVLVERLAAQVYPTAVVLSHDGGGDRHPTLAAYQQLIPRWKAEGYTFDLPAVTGGPYPPACTAPVWQKNSTYVAGNRVSQDGKLYQANWWTRSERPSGAPWTWTSLGAC
ncbi:polysaccharide deacetylase family protein [Actinokineospora terrae]|uniref:Peptidoglycan/xylan/chitin deacetylase, PgdA/CDA1 family n=1 Tax=Actinokineospora terrae TaxID=155974 RepID=A0A1H9KRY4_9PSEU|nr:polysaccharide deacetylase family protein [Actinokineospora terrae]SER01655.1 Peptidoglycan/xylan/chitin deacetylase, PgdA/CDA1 family [Actinokineospora terrae]